MTLLSGCGRRWEAWVAGAALWSGLAGGAAGGQSVPALPGTAQAVLTEMAGRAAIIFTGEVVWIGRADAGGFVDVRFRVDQPVKGVQKNGAYVLREWAGLWTGGAERYRVGQKYLMLLTARGSSGMSAPVGGMDGAIPLTAAGDSPLFRGDGEAPEDKAADAPEAQVDLRWLAARAMRRPAGSQSSFKTGAVRASTAPLTARAGAENAGESISEATPGLRERPPAVDGNTIAAPVTDPGDGGDPGIGKGWPGLVAPLPSAGTNLVEGGAFPMATRLSTILALLSSGNGGTAHVAR